MSRISDLMVRQGEVAAQRELNKGQALSNVAVSLGDMLPGIRKRTIEQQDRQATLQQRTLDQKVGQAQLESAQGQLTDRATARTRAAAVTAALSGPGDIDAKIARLEQVDPEMSLELRTKFANASDAERKSYGSEADAIARAAGAVLQLPPAQRRSAWARSVSEMQGRKVVPAGHVPQTFGADASDDDVTAALQSYFAVGLTGKELSDRQRPIEVSPGATVLDPTTRQPIYTAPAKPKDPAAAGSLEDFVVSKYGAHPTPEQLLEARKLYNQADDKTSQDVTPLSPSALDMAAYTYRITGQMPTLGMGDKVTRGNILNRAAGLTDQDMDRISSGANIPAAKAAFAAGQQTLTQLRKQRAAIGAFETTAQKNIDIFLDQAGKVVDTGSPIANTLVRNVSGRLLGSPDQAGYDAARQVAINEIAKITSNPTLAGQLSDSARHEVGAFNPSNATLKQTVAVMRLLKRDMQNRTTSLDDEIRNTEKTLRTGGRSASPAPVAAEPSPRVNPFRR